MAKKKDTSTEEELLCMSPHKKHKKHKHKKHKRKKGTDQEDEDAGGGSPTALAESLKPLKLKIRIGGQALGEKRVSKAEIPEPSSDDSQSIDVDEISSMLPGMESIMALHQGDSDDEEEAWLEALESGRLEEVDDELRRMKDPTLMTARQRALLESKCQKEKEECVAQPICPVKELTEEMIQRRMLRAKKRKQQAEEKREKDKKQTIERLLKKPDSKPKGTKKLAKRVEVPKVTYINSGNAITLSLPLGHEFPLPHQSARPPPTSVLCGVKGCQNVRKYSCSKTGIPLCSLECYRMNLNTLRSHHASYSGLSGHAMLYKV